MTLAPTDLDRTCGHPDCGAGPFADLRGLAAHRRSHETVTCPECGTEVGALGIGSHRRSAHGVAGRAKARATTPGPREVRRGLHAILPPGIDLDLTARLAAFVVATDNPNGVIVIGGTYGPSLVARRYVGDIVAAAKEPLLVVTTDQLREAGLA